MKESFFDEFFKDSWLFFYKFIIRILREYEKDILDADNISDMVSPIKDTNLIGGFNKFFSVVPIFNDIFTQSKWIVLINGSKSETLNEDHIRKLHNSYDMVNKRFNCKHLD